tara:strand:- start:3967 stop:4422 length:456 start_codon:yes stop_codon:yes gene_type:complete
MICGDHVCINKTEAKQYFEENLTLEVKIIDKQEPEKIDLVELNLGSDSSGKRKISIFNKKRTEKRIISLSKEEIDQRKAQIKKKIKEAKIAKKTKKPLKERKKVKQNLFRNDNNKIVDICTILKDCSIEEISKYLIKKGAKKDFPDITLKE